MSANLLKYNDIKAVFDHTLQVITRLLLSCSCSPFLVPACSCLLIALSGETFFFAPEVIDYDKSESK